MDTSLTAQLAELLCRAYPEPWETAWLGLPGYNSPVGFNVICSDLPANRSRPDWPPASQDHAWIRWTPSDGEGFWIRPRQDDPLLRDRFVLLRSRDHDAPVSDSTISAAALRDAMSFATATGRVVWHNPPKGGSRFPRSAHFQSVPLLRDGRGPASATLPCCSLQLSRSQWQTASSLQMSLILRPRYPILGLAAWGPLPQVADFVWHLIFGYDAARACNLIIEPASASAAPGICRTFVFPRARDPANYSLTADRLRESEMLLMRNCPGGRWSAWPFAGVEMGLLTQVVWGPVYEAMQQEPDAWASTLERLAGELSLRTTDEDWHHFLATVET